MANGPSSVLPDDGRRDRLPFRRRASSVVRANLRIQSRGTMTTGHSAWCSRACAMGPTRMPWRPSPWRCAPATMRSAWLVASVRTAAGVPSATRWLTRTSGYLVPGVGDRLEGGVEVGGGLDGVALDFVGVAGVFHGPGQVPDVDGCRRAPRPGASLKAKSRISSAGSSMSTATRTDHALAELLYGWLRFPGHSGLPIRPGTAAWRLKRPRLRHTDYFGSRSGPRR